MGNYRWARFRTKHSSGPGVWEFMEIGVGDKPDEDLEFAAENYAEENNTWSEHWRGIEYEWCDTPDQEYLKREIKYAEKAIETRKTYISRLKSQIKD